VNAGIAKLETPGAGPDLLRLVELLRSAGFLIGASEAIDASRLVCRLAELDPGMQSRASLRAKLRPIFCKSAEEQTRFDGIFQQWVNEQSTPPGSGKKFVETTAPEHVGSAVTESVKKKTIPQNVALVDTLRSCFGCGRYLVLVLLEYCN
jgi:uncharacterized protein with von Willebrand factor type A (vWA) domain